MDAWKVEFVEPEPWEGPRLVAADSAEDAVNLIASSLGIDPKELKARQ